MKFRVKKTVSCFGVGSSVYYPGDIVEGPDEWAKTNSHILEPIPEPIVPNIALKTSDMAPGPVLMIDTTDVAPIVFGDARTIKTEAEHEKDGSEDRHATADRRPKKR